MPAPKKVYFSTSGNDANPGTYASPKRSPQLVNDLSPGDIALFRGGDVFTPAAGSKDTTFITVKTNGVTFDSYPGPERAANPSFSHTGAKSVVFGVLGNENVFQYLDVWNGESCVALYQTHTGNRIVDCRVQDFGFGIVDKASNTTIENVYLARGRMVRDTGAATDAGAQAIVLEHIDKTVHANTILRNLFIEDCNVPSKAFVLDGAGIEVVGEIEGVLIEGCFMWRLKIGLEFGGVTSRHETIRNLTFRGNVVLAPLAYFNPSTDQFYADLERVAFERNVVANPNAAKSSVYFGGPWGSLAGRVAFTNNLMTGAAQTYNASAGTDLASIPRAGNVYGSSNVGMALALNESVQEIPYVNTAAHDYRLARSIQMPDGTAYTPGAWGVAVPSDDETFSVPTMKNLFTMSAANRYAGRRCFVGQNRTLFELQEDLDTWLKVS